MLNIGCNLEEARYMEQTQENMDKWWKEKEKRINQYVNILLG